MKQIMIFFTVVLLIFLPIISCKTTDKELETIQTMFQQRGITFNNEEKVCVIIPGGGCAGCIASGIFFLKNHGEVFSSSQTTFKVVFTAINSKKLLKREFEDEEWENMNKIIDEDNRYLIPGDNRIYPLVLYLDKGKIYEYAYQTPDTEALMELEERLKDE